MLRKLSGLISVHLFPQAPTFEPMAKKKKTKNRTGEGGIVYSTDPDYVFKDLFGALGEESQSDEHDNQAFLYVSRDKKRRAGKMVTLIEGFTGPEDELNELGKLLKQKCGVGGSVKDGEIIIQGDHRDKVAELLRNKGYKVKLKGG